MFSNGTTEGWIAKDFVIAADRSGKLKSFTGIRMGGGEEPGSRWGGLGVLTSTLRPTHEVSTATGPCVNGPAWELGCNRRATGHGPPAAAHDRQRGLKGPGPHRMATLAGSQPGRQNNRSRPRHWRGGASISPGSGTFQMAQAGGRRGRCWSGSEAGGFDQPHLIAPGGEFAPLIALHHDTTA